jgi:hypothetical protein
VAYGVDQYQTLAKLIALVLTSGATSHGKLIDGHQFCYRHHGIVWYIDTPWMLTRFADELK